MQTDLNKGLYRNKADKLILHLKTCKYCMKSNNVEYNIYWFKETIEPMMKGKYELNYVGGSDSPGNMQGVQFEREEDGGYLYFWSSGYIGMQFFDYVADEEVIEDSMIKEDEEKDEKINSLLRLITEKPS